MIEPLFVSSAPVWAAATPPAWPGGTPWGGTWYQPPPQIPMSPPAGIASQMLPSNSAPMLVAAVAMKRGQPQGPTNDQEVEEVIYDALELFPGAGDVDVRCESGRIILTGTVSHKRLKHDAGEIAWAIPVINDVQNNITIARRRSRSFSRESEQQPVAAGRKPA